MNSCDIPESFYNKAGEKFSLNQGKSQSQNKQGKCSFHKAQHRVIRIVWVLKKFQEIQIDDQQSNKRDQGAFA